MPRRYRRIGARWEDPCSPLQAARFARHWIGQDVCDRVQDVCPGHGNGHCRLDPSKLSEWEHGKGRPSLAHIQALCEVFQTSAEDLGLITWRREPEPDLPPEGTGDPSPASHECCSTCRGLDLERLVLGWVRANAAAVLAATFQAFWQHHGQQPHPPPPQDRG